MAKKKKLNMRGASIFYQFGVHKVRRNDKKLAATKQMEDFFDAINFSAALYL